MKKGIVTVLLMSVSLTSLAAGNPEIGKEKALACGACHGATGVSISGDWPNLAGQGEKYLAKQLRDFKSGARVDPVMSAQAMTIEDEDIEHLAAYFAAQMPAPAATQGVGENPEEMLKLGEQIYRGGIMAKDVPACMACHSPNGIGIEPAAFPALSAQQVPYVRKQLSAFANAANSDELASDTDTSAMVMRSNDPNAMMRDIASKLTPKEIEAVAYYMQGLH